MPPTDNSHDDSERFARQAQSSSPGTMRELWDFLRANKKWWLTPIVVMLVLVGTLSVLAATGLAPLIYTLF
jgi:hypothetical protein